MAPKARSGTAAEGEGVALIIMVYWVIVRNLTTGKILAQHAFKTHQEANLKMRELNEAPDPEGHQCKVEIQMLWHPEQPK